MITEPINSNNQILNEMHQNGAKVGTFIDTEGNAFYIKQVDGKVRVSSMPYLFDIAEGNVEAHTTFTKIGYCPSLSANVNTDIWSYAPTQPVYLFPTTPQQMEFLSSNNVDDKGIIIKTGTASSASTTTMLYDSTANFTATTAVTIGDVVILDKDGIEPEYGYVTAVAATALTISAGFSYGGSASKKNYIIIDETATNGAQSVEIVYLDGNYQQKREICILSGTTVGLTTNTNLFRINNFRVIAAGANKIPTGNLTLRNIANTPVYSYITAGFNRARNAMYTVPAGKVLYVTDFAAGYATSGNANKEYARITTRANVDPTTKFKTDSLFYPFTDALCQNTTINTVLQMPTKLPAKTDIKVSAIASANGSIISTLRGWLENE